MSITFKRTSTILKKSRGGARCSHGCQLTSMVFLKTSSKSLLYAAYPWKWHRYLHSLTSVTWFAGFAPEEEARSLLPLGLPIPAYVWMIYIHYLDYKQLIDKLISGTFIYNELGTIRFWRPLTLSIFLDSRGFVGVTERAKYFGRMQRSGTIILVFLLCFLMCYLLILETCCLSIPSWETALPCLSFPVIRG